MGKKIHDEGQDRRWFLATLGSTAAGLISSCGARRGAAEDEGYDPEEGPPAPTRVYPVMPAAVVGMAGVSGPGPERIHAAVREAVMGAGGLDFLEPGQRVLIKPNLCGPAIKDKYPGRITTHPEVVRAVIRLCRERGAGEVLVSDRGMFGTNLAMKTSGIERVCREEGAVAWPWTRAEYVRFYPGKRYWRQGFRFPKVLTEVDHFINVPLLKNHGAVAGADFTCCLKSFVGVCHSQDRHLGGPDELHDRKISAKVAELNLCARPAMNIVDATQIMVAGGPDGLSRKRSVWVEANLVLASADRVACDSLALAVLKRHAAERKIDLPYVSRSVWDQAQIYYAGELGIGQADPAMITIADHQVPLLDEFKSNWT
jgi:uncharacterized protein (DUF362 family)